MHKILNVLFTKLMPKNEKYVLRIFVDIQF